MVTGLGLGLGSVLGLRLGSVLWLGSVLVYISYLQSRQFHYRPIQQQRRHLLICQLYIGHSRC